MNCYEPHAEKLTAALRTSRASKRGLDEVTRRRYRHFYDRTGRKPLICDDDSRKRDRSLPEPETDLVSSKVKSEQNEAPIRLIGASHFKQLRLSVPLVGGKG